MRFLFVDRIRSRSAAGDISGDCYFPADEPLRYEGADGVEQVAPGVVSEAIGQLASWLCLEANGFQARPVFLFADRILVHAPVRPGSLLSLTAQVHQQDHESMRFSGRAMVGETLVLEVMNCSGFFMPLAELENPEVTKARFEALIVAGAPTSTPSQRVAYDFAALGGDTLALELGRRVHTRRRYAASEPFYADHFPRQPVTPIVMLNEMIGAATARLFGEGWRGLRIKEISGIKIRSFVRPEEEIEIIVSVDRLRESAAVTPGANVTAGKGLDTVAEVLKDGRRILRGKYSYDVL